MDIKMGDVFKLPMTSHWNDGEMSLADKEYYLANFDDSLTYEDGKGLNRAEYAAIAINSYDKNQELILKMYDKLAELETIFSETEGDATARHTRTFGEQSRIADILKEVDND